jgi:hypothetical protein
VAAISGGAVIDPFSEETRLVESALQESLIRTTSGVWPVLDLSNRHALLSHQQLAESGYGDSLVSMPIQTESGDAMGCILVTLPFNLKRRHQNRSHSRSRTLSPRRGWRSGWLSWHPSESRGQSLAVHDPWCSRSALHVTPCKWRRG